MTKLLIRIHDDRSAEFSYRDDLVIRLGFLQQKGVHDTPGYKGSISTERHRRLFQKIREFFDPKTVYWQAGYVHKLRAKCISTFFKHVIQGKAMNIKNAN